MPVTDDGTAHGKLLGVVTERDYRLSRMSGDEKVSEFMTPREKLIVAEGDTVETHEAQLRDKNIYLTSIHS